jgi:hypothetical protein
MQLLVLLLVVAATHDAAAAPALLGCFSATAVSLQPDTAAVVDGAAESLPSACTDRCAKLRHPLAALQQGGRCACSSVIPAAALTEDACSPAALEGGAADLYYNHQGAM